MQERRIAIQDQVQELDLAYLEWPHAEPQGTIVCVHGLTRNAHDFDRLGDRLQDRYRVLAVDVTGRGRSSWLDDKARYALPTYIEHLKEFLRRMELEEVIWIGTSMGGIIGTFIAATESAAIGRLVLNDIGAFVDRDALNEIASYLQEQPRFASIDDAEAHLRRIHAGFGQLDDAQWRRITVNSVREVGDAFAFHFDPGLIAQFRNYAAEDVQFWEIYEQIGCPVLLLHGVHSRILTAETARQMTERGPQASLIDYADVGHAPSLMTPDQIDDIAVWLERTSRRDI